MSQGDQPPAERMRYIIEGSITDESLDVYHNMPNRNRNGPLQLMDLDDDCLLAVLKNMNAMELVDIAETCKRAQALAQYAFRLKHHRLDLTTIERINLKLTMRLLRNFGHDISSLNIPRKMLSPEETDKASKKILKLIGRHCHTNLVELSLKNIRMTADMMDQRMEEIFGSLKTIILENFSFKNCDLSRLNEHLEVLKLKNVDFPNTSAITPNYYKPLTTFLTRASALKHLSIIKCQRLPCHILKVISQLSQLEKLEIDLHMKAHDNVVKGKLVNLAALRELRVLKMGCYGISPQAMLKEFVTNNIEIEHLDLTLIDDNSFIQVVAELKTIKTLKLIDVWGITDAYLLSLAKGLKSLSELHVVHRSGALTRHGILEMIREADRLTSLHILNSSFIFGINTYNDVLEIIRNRSEYIKLELTIHGFTREPIFDPHNALHSNDKWLKVNHIRGLTYTPF